MFRKCMWLMCGMGLCGSLAGQAVAASQEPLVYYPFEQLGALVVDASGNGHDGTPNGALVLGDGYVERCFQLNGNDTYVELARPIQDDFTLAAWIRTEAPGHEEGTSAFHGSGLFWADVGGSSNDFVVAVLGTKLSFNVGNPNTTVTSSGDVVTGDWVHVAAVRDITAGTISLFVNGALDGRLNHSNRESLTANAMLFIGANIRDVRYYTGLIDEVRIYDTVLTAEEIQQVMKGIPPSSASEPSPADGATDVPRDVVLSWQPGEFAAPINGHKVYFGENFNDVNDGIGAITQSATSYAPPQRLDFDKTYYWRVDEVNSPPDYTVFEGVIWSFTTEPVGYPIANVTATASSSTPGQGPENTVNGSGLSDDLHSAETETMWLSAFGGPQPTWIQFEFDKVRVLHEMWVWNSNTDLEASIGFGFRDVTIEYSVDGTDYLTFGTTHEFNKAPGTDDYAHNTTVDFGGLQAKYVRLTVNSSWGGWLPQFGLSEVRFFDIPVYAREPHPDSGATDVDVDVTLAFRAGRQAAEHNVYLSADEQAVIDGNAPVTVVTEASHSPSPLDLGATYYWRVDEVNAAETPTTWQGDVWDFTTQEYIVVDDFESYNEIPSGEPGSKLIYETWADGYANPATNGSAIGYLTAVSMETGIVHGGDQSAPLLYDNSAASLSEVTVDPAVLAIGRDWTMGAPETLVLWFHGNPGNAVTEQMYVKVNGNKVPYPGEAADIARPRWKQWNIDLAALGVNLSNITQLGIGLERTGAFGGAGTVLID
ncbi:MAG: LamG-like jellyroll fold domain-containing protein, partial [Planctomycetota bacterium]